MQRGKKAKVESVEWGKKADTQQKSIIESYLSEPAEEQRH